MIRQSLCKLLEDYTTPFSEELYMRDKTLEFVLSHPNCFERSLEIGHITVSAIPFVRETKEVLLIHHRKIGKWFQPGGHCDGDSEVLRVARKELMEETGISTGEWHTQIYDIDIHPIFDAKGSHHHHFDIRFLVELPLETKIQIDQKEIISARFIPIGEVFQFNNDRSVLRFIEKLSEN